MAGDSVIGTLRVVIGADSAALEKGLNDARGKLQDFGSQVATAGAVIGVALTAAFASVSVGINGALDKMEGFAKQSQKIGIPVGQLSALALAADVADVSMDQLQGGLGKLSKAMVEAAAKPTSEAANAFRALGVQVTGANGQLLPVIDVTTAIAGKFEGLKDGAGKTAVSMAIFGKSGAELIPLLNMGSAGLQDMMQAAAKFGIVVDSQTAAAADKFRDSLKLLAAAKDGIIIRLTASLLPLMQAFGDRMLATASNADKQNAKLQLLTTVMTGFGRAVLLVVDNFGALLKIGAVFAAATVATAVINMAIAFVGLARAVQAAGLMMAAFEAIRAIGTKGLLILVGLVALATGQFENLTNAIKDIAGKIGDALPQGATKAFSDVVKALGFDLSALTTDFAKSGSAASNAAKGQQDFNYAALGGKNAVDQFLASQQKSIASQLAEAQTVGLAAGAKERLKTVLEALQIATTNNIPITDALRAKIADTALQAEQAALKLQGMQLVQQNLTPLQAYTQELNNVNTAMMAVGATSDQIARAQDAVGQKFGMTWEAIGGNFANTAGALSNLAGTFAKENKAMGIASKAFGIGQAIINTQIAITKALATLPPPASYAAVAFAIAQGAASVASIAAQKFALGGSFTVPGGTSMSDNVVVPMALSSGERVSVESNHNQGSRGSAADGPPVYLTINGDNHSREGIRGLVLQINQVLGLEGRLKLA